ncbi:hypothetical protein ABFS83_03G025600 [Erythranthe nasuta]
MFARKMIFLDLRPLLWTVLFHRCGNKVEFSSETTDYLFAKREERLFRRPTRQSVPFFCGLCRNSIFTLYMLTV